MKETIERIRTRFDIPGLEATMRSRPLFYDTEKPVFDTAMGCIKEIERTIANNKPPVHLGDMGTPKQSPVRKTAGRKKRRRK